MNAPSPSPSHKVMWQRALEVAIAAIVIAGGTTYMLAHDLDIQMRHLAERFEVTSETMNNKIDRIVAAGDRRADELERTDLRQWEIIEDLMEHRTKVEVMLDLQRLSPRREPRDWGELVHPEE